MAVLRIYLEVINFKFSALPLTKAMGQSGAKFHKMGLYISVGYVVLFAPQVLLS